MPNNNTPETPGFTTSNLPIIGRQEAWFTDTAKGKIQIAVGGILYAIRVTAQSGDLRFRNAAIAFEITDIPGIGHHGGVFKPSYQVAPWDMNDILIILDKPTPNLNAAFPLVFRWDSESTFGIRSITSYHRIP